MGERKGSLRKERAGMLSAAMEAAWNATRRRDYEQERLILYVQEALATAVERSGLKRSDVARSLRVSPPYVTMVLNQGRNLTLETVADFALACGFRVVPTLEPLNLGPNERAADPPARIEGPSTRSGG